MIHRHLEDRWSRFSENDAKKLLEDLQNTIPCAKIIGYIEEKEEKSIILE